MVKKKCNEFRDDDSSTESNDDGSMPSHQTPGEKCIHVKKAIDPTMVKKKLKLNGLEKQCSKCVENKSTAKPVLSAVGDGLELEEDRSSLSLWLCLQCGTQLCGRYCNQHALQHCEAPRSESHLIAMNTTDLRVWCYQCDTQINEKLVPKLLDCYEFVKREAEKMKNDPPKIVDVERKLQAAVSEIRAVMGGAVPTPVVSGSSVTSSTMGLAGSQNQLSNSINVSTTSSTTPNYRDLRLDIVRSPTSAIIDGLPRVRGLSNLGNTCFFNAVLQCLARTPFLLDVLKESAAQGEKFQLPGGPYKMKDGTETELIPISGKLNAWGSLTESLAETLTELQSGGGVFSPSKLLRQLTGKWPQFAGAEQHDSHELLRHLLESVRSEDLRRYQLVILLALGFKRNVDPQTVEDSIKEKVKFYGMQAADRIFRPEPVFRGFLVSTLTCQDCYHVSSRHESFLDLSLPVSAEKPQPPIRRKGSPEPDYGYGASSSSSVINSKPLSNKERRRIKKAAAKKDKNLLNLNATVIVGAAPTNDAGTHSAAGGAADVDSGADDDDGMSDADVEDNLTDDSQPKKLGSAQVDQNGNQQLIGPEKADDTPENPNKEGVGGGNDPNVVCELGLSAEGVANMMEKISLNSSGDQQQDELDAKKLKMRRQRTYSHADWGSTLAPRYQCEDNECSIQSCLNGFTAVELMTGSNKVCCDACTERINGKDGKSVNTNATKQFLISSPPAVLILHLKRFQVGPRGMLRKITKSVTFPFLLDIAPFCGSKVKKLPNVKQGQKKLLYSLYGIVEHSGTMHGGHYVAYVKVRPQLARDDPRWEFLPKGSKAELDQKDEEAIQLEKEIAKEQARNLTIAARDSDDALSSSSSVSSCRSSTGTTTSDGEEEGAVGYTPKPELLPDMEPQPGKWYYVSDSHVRETTEQQVLNAQAYLLFYERIF